MSLTILEHMVLKLDGERCLAVLANIQVVKLCLEALRLCLESCVFWAYG